MHFASKALGPMNVNRDSGIFCVQESLSLSYNLEKFHPFVPKKVIIALVKQALILACLLCKCSCSQLVKLSSVTVIQYLMHPFHRIKPRCRPRLLFLAILRAHSRQHSGSLK